ncbi:MAG: PIN domain nuclease [Acidimicrobiia bacterium]
MAAVATHLIDASALARLDRPAVFEMLAPLIEAGLVATCATLELEVRYSARNADDYEQIARDRAVAFEMLPADDWIATRALEVQAALATTGQHRAVKLAYLLIAATAERHRVEILHYDHDFDRIAQVTHQPTRWVAPAGEIP